MTITWVFRRKQCKLWSLASEIHVWIHHQQTEASLNNTPEQKACRSLRSFWVELPRKRTHLRFWARLSLGGFSSANAPEQSSTALLQSSSLLLRAGEQERLSECRHALTQTSASSFWPPVSTRFYDCSDLWSDCSHESYFVKNKITIHFIHNIIALYIQQNLKAPLLHRDPRTDGGRGTFAHLSCIIRSRMKDSL